MQKIILFDKNALDDVNQLPTQAKTELLALLKILENEGKLEFPYAKKIDNKIFEIRIKVKTSYRVFYAYIQEKYVIILHMYNKKTQKTPLKEIKLAHRRLKKI